MADAEWIVRPWARRVVRQHLRRAEVATQSLDVAHLARLALLTDASTIIDADDVDGVQAAWSKMPPIRRRSIPVVLLSLCMLLSAAVLASWLVHRARRPFDPTRDGVGAALHERLTPYVVGVTNGKLLGPKAAKAVFARPESELGEASGRSFEKMLQTYEQCARDSSALTSLFAEVRNVNRAFAGSGLPYYFDAQLWAPTKPILYAHYVEREDVATTPGYEPERIVYLWRLDTLNIADTYLGYTHREADAALVLYDSTETFLLREVLPSLVEGETVDLIDAASRAPNTAWQDDIEARSARMVRESFANDAERDKLLALGSLLARRRAIVASWRGALSGQGRVLREPERLFPEADYAEDLWHKVPTKSRDEWEEIHEALREKSMLATFEALRDRFARDVARHEVQHRLDGQRTKACAPAIPCDALRVPPLVRQYAGGQADDAVVLGTFPARVTEETSAYLAELAFPTGMPKMTLLALLGWVLDREAWGSAYCNTALVVLDALASELGLSDPNYPLVAGGAVQRASTSSLVVLLFAKTDTELRGAAARAWKVLYGSELVHPVIERTRQGEDWRH